MNQFAFLLTWQFWVFTAVMSAVMYPFWGAVMYGNPWTWIFKEREK